MLPKDRMDKETDRNPHTAYEDRSEHERRGFIRDEDRGMDPILKDPKDDFLD